MNSKFLFFASIFFLFGLFPNVHSQTAQPCICPSLNLINNGCFETLDPFYNCVGGVGNRWDLSTGMGPVLGWVTTKGTPDLLSANYAACPIPIPLTPNHLSMPINHLSGMVPPGTPNTSPNMVGFKNDDDINPGIAEGIAISLGTSPLSSTGSNNRYVLALRIMEYKTPGYSFGDQLNIWLTNGGPVSSQPQTVPDFDIISNSTIAGSGMTPTSAFQTYVYCFDPTGVAGLDHLVIEAEPISGTGVNDYVAYFVDDVQMRKLSDIADAGPDIFLNCPNNIIGPQCHDFPGAVYTWTPAAGLDNPNIANPRVIGTITVPTVYTLTVTFPNNPGCTYPSQSVTVNPGLTGTLNTSLFSPTNCTAFLTAVPSGGTGVYSYAWGNGAGNTNTIGPLCAGNYTVTITDAGGCNIVLNTTLGGPIFPNQLTGVNCDCDGINLVNNGCFENGLDPHDPASAFISSLPFSTNPRTIWPNFPAGRSSVIGWWPIASPDLMIRQTTPNWSSQFANPFPIPPLFISWNGAPNDRFVGFSSNISVTPGHEGVQTELTTALIPGNTYAVSFYANRIQTAGAGLYTELSLLLGNSFGGSSQTRSPATFNIVTNSSVNMLGGIPITAGGWNNYTVCFTVPTNAGQLDHLTIEPTVPNQPSGAEFHYFLLDDVVITEVHNVANAGPDLNGCGVIGTNRTCFQGAQYNWTPSSGLANPTNFLTQASPSTSTTYTLSVTLGGTPGCVVTDVVDVNVNQQLIANTKDQSCQLHCDGEIHLSATGFTNPIYTWTFNGSPFPQTTASITGLCAGVYEVTVSDPNGTNCVRKMSFTIANLGINNFPITTTNTQSTFSDHADDIISDAMGDLYLSGGYDVSTNLLGSSLNPISSTSTDLFVAKINPCGKLLWSVNSNHGVSLINDVVLDEQNQLMYVTGTYQGFVTFNGANGTSTSITASNSFGLGTAFENSFIAKYDMNSGAILALNDNLNGLFSKSFEPRALGISRLGTIFIAGNSGYLSAQNTIPASGCSYNSTIGDKPNYLIAHLNTTLISIQWVLEPTTGLAGFLGKQYVDELVVNTDGIHGDSIYVSGTYWNNAEFDHLTLSGNNCDPGSVFLVKIANDPFSANSSTHHVLFAVSCEGAEATALTNVPGYGVYIAGNYWDVLHNPFGSSVNYLAPALPAPAKVGWIARLEQNNGLLLNFRQEPGVGEISEINSIAGSSSGVYTSQTRGTDHQRPYYTPKSWPLYNLASQRALLYKYDHLLSSTFMFNTSTTAFGSTNSGAVSTGITTDIYGSVITTGMYTGTVYFGTQSLTQTGISPNVYVLRAEPVQLNYFSDFKEMEDESSPLDIELAIRLYPNPVKDKIQLEFSTVISGNLELKIYSSEGKMVKIKSAIIEDQKWFEIVGADLAPGVYVIRVSTSGKSFNSKFIKE